MRVEINKKVIISITITIILLSALVYNLLYINNKKNEIIEEIEFEDIEEEEIEEEKTIFIDVGGEVTAPGLYELPENSRVNDAIIAAGGVTDKADLTVVNLAFVLSDAMKVIIPEKEIKKSSAKTSQTPVKNVVTTAVTATETSLDDALININSSTKEQLKKLTGIGDATAQKIIDYRNEKGKFNNIEDLKNVSGIGEAKFEKIKNKICV